MMISKNLLLRFVWVSVILATVFSCNKEEPVPALPEIELGQSVLTFGYEGGPQSVDIKVNRPWKAVFDSQWLAVDPAEGDGTETSVKVTALMNEAGDGRTAQIMFKTLAVYDRLEIVQEANPEKAPSVYYVNDLDKEAAVDNNGWPYADEFDGWKNQTGAGSENVRYFTSGVSIRTNSGSDSNYSDYAGSGGNNMFFGKDAWFVIADIGIHTDQLAYSLSFGTEKYLYGSSDNTFNPEEFPVMVSVDGSTWYSLEYTFATGQYLDGRWDLATATFTLPEPAQKLWVRFAPTIASAHRLDDISLVASSSEGQKIDWSKGQQITVPGA